MARAADWLRNTLQRGARRVLPAPATLSELMAMSIVTQGIHTAAELGIADVLAGGPLSAAEIARRVAADADGVHRLLRALAGQGVFTQRRDGRYALNALAQPLRSDADPSLRALILFAGAPVHREHWSRLTDAVRTGQVVVPQVRGMGFFDYLAHNPEFGEVFAGAMSGTSQMFQMSVLDAFDFTPYRRFVDVGGGRGQLLIEILQRAPLATGVLFDLPAALEGVQAELELAGIGDRCTVSPGSFFDSVPAGGDAYLLKFIVHDWPEPDALRILRNVRAAMPSGARLLLIEYILPEGPRPHPGKVIDLEMLTMTGGRERTVAEYRRLLAQADLQLVRQVPTAGPMSVLEARLR